MKSLKQLFANDPKPSDTPRLPTQWQMPIDGKVIPLSALPDQVFAQGMMGAGFAIQATGNTVCSPLDATVATIFPGGHAIALQGDDGTAVLIHVGIDSVGLKGQGFRVLIDKDTTTVKAGQALVEVDFDFLANKLPDSAVVIVFTDIEEGQISIDNGKPVWTA